MVFCFVLGDEMFSDSYKMKLVDEVIYEVYGKVRFVF
jgi:Translationally controlled tumour protein.